MAERKPYDLGRPMRALDAWDCRLTAPATQDSNGKEPFLYLDFRYHKDGKVRDIEMSVNLRKEGKYNKIKFFPTVTQFEMICLAIDDAANGRIPEDLIKIEPMVTFLNGERTPEPVPELMIAIGRDEEGVFMGYAPPRGQNVRFHFKAPRTQFRARDGSIITNAYASALAARARSSIWRRQIHAALEAGYINDAELEVVKAENKAKAQRAFGDRNRGNGGGYQNNNGGGNNYQKPNNQYQNSAPSQPAAAPSQEFDNDLPW